MEIIIKEASLENLEQIQELNLKLFEKEQKEYDSLLNLNWTFSEVGTQYYKNRISKDNGCVLIAVFNDNVIGYLCGGLKSENSNTYRMLPIVAELENMFVLDEFRSKGVGKKLYAEFVMWCRRKNVGKIQVEASAKNELAIKFYRDNDFKDYSVVLERDL